MIIFHHIPKTAGTFLFSQMKKHYKYISLAPGNPQTKFEKEICEYFGNNFEGKIFQKNTNKIDKDTFFRAHGKFFNYNKKYDTDFYFTCLRNPVDMFYSEHTFRSNKNINELLNLLDEKIDNMKKIWRCDQFYNLERFDFVGITEHMEETIKVLNAKLNIKIKNLKLNVNKRKEKNIIYSHRRNELEEKFKNSPAYEVYYKYIEKLKDLAR
jgi:hypothetical protein